MHACVSTFAFAFAFVIVIVIVIVSVCVCVCVCLCVCVCVCMLLVMNYTCQFMSILFSQCLGQLAILGIVHEHNCYHHTAVTGVCAYGFLCCDVL